MTPHEFHLNSKPTKRGSSAPPWWRRTTVAASHCPSQATAWWELGMGLRDNHNYNESITVDSPRCGEVSTSIGSDTDGQNRMG